MLLPFAQNCLSVSTLQEAFPLISKKRQRYFVFDLNESYFFNKTACGCLVTSASQSLSLSLFFLFFGKQWKQIKQDAFQSEFGCCKFL